MNGFSLIFEVLMLAAVAIVFGAVVAGTARLGHAISHRRGRRHMPRMHRG